jgi:hypothetical protein
MKQPDFPFGPAAAIAVTSGATMAATVEQNETVITISQMTGAGTLNLTIDSELKDGSSLVIRASADGTNRVLTLGTGLTGNAVTVLANKTFNISAKLISGAFVVTSVLQEN